MKKIYIAGCGGMLGEAFHRQFKEDYILKCTDKDVNADWLSYLNFCYPDTYEKDVKDFQPDYLFHLGALTDLEFCEKFPVDAYQTNTESVKTAVRIANDLNIPILYISTAGIFAGDKASYDESDLPEPLGTYGRTKYDGELYVKENANRYLICRAGWMMGGWNKDKKFVGKILSQIYKGRRAIHVVTDKNGTPTYTQDFAKNVKLLVEKNCTGLYNMVCEGMTSRYEVAQEILSILGFEEDIELIGVSSDYFKKEYFAPRPDCERLINTKLDTEGLNFMRPWKVALREYLSHFDTDRIIS